MLHLVSHSIYTGHAGSEQGFFPDVVYELLYLPFLSLSQVTSPFHLQNQHAELLHDTG